MILSGKIILGNEGSVGAGKIGIFAGDDDNIYIKLSNGSVYPIIAGTSSGSFDGVYTKIDGSNGPYGTFEFSSGEGIDSSGILNVGSNSNVINIGGSGTLVNIFGTTSYISSTELEVSDRLITLNKGGSTASGIGSGFTIEENGIPIGYFKTNSNRDGFLIKGPGSTYSVNLLLSSLNSDQTLDFPDTSGKIALTSDLANYLSLAGGAMNSNATITGQSVYFPLVTANNTIELSHAGGLKLGIYLESVRNATPTEYSTLTVAPQSVSLYTTNITNGSSVYTFASDGFTFGSGDTLMQSSKTASYVKLKTTSNAAYAILKTTNLTGDEVFEFPPESGTICLLENLSDKLDKDNSSIAIVDSSTMDIASPKNTLTTSSATRTFTISYTGDVIRLWITLNTTGCDLTFPATALCVSEGISSGNNILTIVGSSGNKYLVEIFKEDINYTVLSKNISA